MARTHEARDMDSWPVATTGILGSTRTHCTVPGRRTTRYPYWYHGVPFLSRSYSTQRSFGGSDSCSKHSTFTSSINGKMNRAFLFGTLLFALLLSAFTMKVSGAVEPRKDPMAGGYGEIPDLNEERVQNAATFAVTELQRQQPELYSFHIPSEFKILIAKGYRQVVAGMNYKLIIVITKSEGETIPLADNIVGSFGVTVYDKFGELSVTNWGNELSIDRAMQLILNRDKFGQVSDEDFGK